MGPAHLLIINYCTHCQKFKRLTKREQSALFQHYTLSCLNWRTFWHTQSLSNSTGTTGIAAAPLPSSQVAPPSVTHIAVLTMSGITKWHCQQRGVRQGVCMYTTTSALSATDNSLDQHEHTWCTNLSHNSFSPHWAHTHRPILHQYRSRRSAPPHMLSGSANDPALVTLLTVPGPSHSHWSTTWEELRGVGREMCVHDGEQFVPITYSICNAMRARDCESQSVCL